MAATPSQFSIVFSAGDGETPTASDPGAFAASMKQYFKNLHSRFCRGDHTLTVRTGAVKASASVTCVGVLAADTLTVAGVVFTAVTGASGANQFTRGVSDSADAIALAAAINTSVSPGIVGCVSAVSIAAAVLITAANPGLIGNAITVVSSNGARLSPSAARLTGGAETLVTVSY